MIENIVKQKRLDKGLTATQLASDLGISLRQYRRIENLQFKNANLNTLEKISKHLNIDIAYLVHYFVENTKKF